MRTKTGRRQGASFHWGSLSSSSWFSSSSSIFAVVFEDENENENEDEGLSALKRRALPRPTSSFQKGMAHPPSMGLQSNP